MAYWIKTNATGNEFQLILILKQYNNRVFRSSHKNGYLTFVPMLYIWTDASLLSYVQMLSYTKNFIPDTCGQHLNN